MRPSWSKVASLAQKSLTLQLFLVLRACSLLKRVIPFRIFV